MGMERRGEKGGNRSRRGRPRSDGRAAPRRAATLRGKKKKKKKKDTRRTAGVV